MGSKSGKRRQQRTQAIERGDAKTASRPPANGEARSSPATAPVPSEAVPPPPPAGAEAPLAATHETALVRMTSEGTPADEAATKSLRPAEAPRSPAAKAPHPPPVTVELAAVPKAIPAASPEPALAELPLPPLRPAAWVAPLPPALRDPSFAPESPRELPAPPRPPETLVSPPLPAPSRNHALEARFQRLEARLDALVQWVDTVAEFDRRRATTTAPAPAIERRVLLVLVMVGAFLPVLGILVALARLWS